MSDFDIERAKAGELIEYNTALNQWAKAHFVGLDLDGWPVVQIIGNNGCFPAHKINIRMATKKIKVRYRCYLDRSDNRVIAVNDESLSKSIEDAVLWLTDWQEVEI